MKQISSKDLINIKEMVDFGILQEANRLFFHPLGLAMVVRFNDNESGGEIIGLIDKRNEPEGIVFKFDLDEIKVENVKNLLIKKIENREKLFGWKIQPVKNKKNDEEEIVEQ
jgi:hypothetical protein